MCGSACFSPVSWEGKGERDQNLSLVTTFLLSVVYCLNLGIKYNLNAFVTQKTHAGTHICCGD